MGLSGKQKNDKAIPLRDLASGRLNGFYNKFKTAWANWMALRTTGLTKKGLMTVLACFVLLIGSYSSYLIISAFTGSPATSIKVGSIRRPAYAGNTGEAKTKAQLSDVDYNRIAQFHRSMDSLSRDPKGKKAYDSIVAKRPGLMDSIRLVENYYQQLKHK